MRGVRSMLDMGTGGGEFLAALAPLPPRTWATEAYPPNVPIARRRMEPLGVQVEPIESDDHLPFGDGQFDLVVNRHESFRAAEVFRILRPGGAFVTQQVGEANAAGLNELLGSPVEPTDSGWLERSLAYLRAAGFDVLDAKEELPEAVFRDVGAVVYYLKAIPWQVRGFDPDHYREQLRTIHERIRRDGGLTVHIHRFLVEVVKPG